MSRRHKLRQIFPTAARRAVAAAAARAIPTFKAALGSAAAQRATSRSQLLDALRGLGASATDLERDQAQKRVFAVLSRQQLDLELKKADGSLKGAASRLLAPGGSFATSLSQVPHLGCLHSLANTAASREDYVRLWTWYLLRLKEEHRGLGLGSRVPRFPKLPAIDPSGTLTGLELAQLWVILVNAGHLFGTFATERALLARIVSRGEERQLVSLLPSQLRSRCEYFLSRRSYYRFFYVLAAVRISMIADHELRDALATVLERYVAEDREELASLRWAFVKSRQLAMLEMHRLLGLGSAKGLDSRAWNLRSLLHGGGIVGHTASLPHSRLSRLLDHTQAFQGYFFFSDAAAASIVLRHVAEFNRWWDRSSAPLEERLSKLFSKPSDWPDGEELHVRHFARVELPVENADSEWFGVVDSWRAADSAAIWTKDRFMVTPLSASSTTQTAEPGAFLLADYYIGGEHVEPRSLQFFAAEVSKRVVASWEADRIGEPEKRLWLSVAQFGVACLELAIVQGLRAQLRPIDASDGSIGLAILGPSPAEALSRLRLFIERCNDAQRKGELRCLEESLAESIGAFGDGPTLVFLAQTILYDTADSPRYEFDGLFAVFGRDAVEWRALQCKKTHAPGIIAQSDALASFLEVPSARRRGPRVDGQKVEQVVFRWPGTVVAIVDWETDRPQVRRGGACETAATTDEADRE